MTRSQLAPLSTNEEVTLRRVALGESEVRAMRAQDLVQLRRLRLIEDGKDGPRLTAEGKQRFDALPRASTLVNFGTNEDPLATMTRMLDATKR
jgi:hypothetical protein